MNIDDAAKATRKHEIGTNACDRLNLVAVLEAIREPSEEMSSAGADRIEVSSPIADHAWRAMIDALIAEAAAVGGK